MDYFNRKRNVQEPSGEPYELAFTQTEITERGWTVSMIRRHLGKPNAVTCCPTTYQYDRRRVYAAEGTPAVQFDLLATEDVRLIGPKWLHHYAAYIPNILKAALETRAANAEDEAEKVQCRLLAASLPAPKPRNARHGPPAPPPAPAAPVLAPTIPQRWPAPLQQP